MHPGRGATDADRLGRQPIFVSIHAPREGCDVFGLNKPNTQLKFQFTHPGRGATETSRSIMSLWIRFQFTHPGRGATRRMSGSTGSLLVSIHAPREGCDCEVFKVAVRHVSVSIHAPREGCDGTMFDVTTPIAEFQFTHPGRGATAFVMQLHCKVVVSIHAPREGCDARALQVAQSTIVSIHAPREGCDTPRRSHCDQPQTFQFTHPGRGATYHLPIKATRLLVSIHAPREGCDC